MLVPWSAFSACILTASAVVAQLRGNPTAAPPSHSKMVCEPKAGSVLTAGGFSFWGSFTTLWSPLKSCSHLLWPPALFQAHTLPSPGFEPATAFTIV
jgi:hypothetical protein